MNIDRERADALFERGHFGELAALVDSATRNGIRTDPSVYAVAAHGLALAGEIDAANRLIDTLRSGEGPRRALVRVAEGIVAERSGSADNAAQLYQSAISIASEDREHAERAWAHLHLFRLLAETRPSDADGLIPELKRSVITAGRPSSSAYLHACVAVLEGQRGRFVIARGHCDIADSILAGANNHWIAAVNLLNRGCLAISEGDFGASLKFLGEARTLATAFGFKRIATRAEANAGHVLMLRGEFDKARATFTSALDTASSNFVTLGLLENFCRLELAANDLNATSERLQQLAEFSLKSGTPAFYHVRWAGLTKARLLTRQTKFLEALDELVHTQQRAEVAGDLPLKGNVHLLKSEILVKQKRLVASARELFDAGLIAADIPELLPTYWFSAGRSVTGRDDSLSRILKERASRRWAFMGVSLPSLEVEPERDRSHFQQLEELRLPSIEHVAPTLNCMSALLDIADEPRMFGEELSRLFRAVGAVVSLKVGPLPNREDVSGYALSLGTLGKKAFTLIVPWPTDPVAAVAMGDIIRLARGAIDLKNSRQEVRDRTSLWETDLTPSDQGGVFLEEAMQSLLATARRIASTNIPVLITGETGTGKEVLARTIHSYSQRAAKTFLPFNCTAVPRDMLDAQLFGHRRGAFTGATENFAGIIRGASGGTLFLDEIGEASLEIQPKLLRFLEAGEVHPIGETHPTKVDTRVIAATNADLDSLVAQGRFREDLFYRLNIVRLHVPPLRERRVEIPALANHYLQKHAQECGKRELRIAEETMEYLVLYRWPGNVRQLANEMRRMTALAENGAVLMPEHLSPDIAASRRRLPASERKLEPIELVVRMDQPMSAAVDHLERAMILHALERTGGHMEQTADLLGLSRKGLYLKRQRFGLETPGGADIEPV